MAYTDLELDIGVTLVGGGYLTTWGAVNQPWLEPVDDDILTQPLYVIDEEIPDMVQRFKPEDLHIAVRVEPYLSKAFAIITDALPESEINIYESDIYYIETNETITTWVVNIGGITTYNVDLEVAKWEAVGVWGINFI